MDSYVDERDFELLAQDKYTFSVLERVMGGPCDLIRSDHHSVILCHSQAPFPVWLWTRDRCDQAELEAAWALVAAHRPIEAGYRYNIKREAAAYFIEKARQEGLDVGVSMQLFAYDCPAPVAPEQPTDGDMHVCTPEDMDEAAVLFARFFEEIGEPVPSREKCLERARAHIDHQALFFWKDAAGRTVACCSYNTHSGLASMGSVYTLPEARRRHYAQHLVYRVTKRVSDAGFMPMLYTDADYPASNACYEKIGYILRGGLYTISLRRPCAEDAHT